MLHDLKLTLAIVALLFAGRAVAGESPETTSAHGVDLAAIDWSVKPGDDFYQFANGKWLAATRVPADRAQVDSFTLVIDRTREVLGQILEKAARQTDRPRDPVAGKVRSFYKSGMDTDRIEAAGVRPLEPILKRIAADQDQQSLLPAIACLHGYRVFAGFQFAAVPDLKHSSRMIAQLSQGGLGLPDRDYYLKDDDQAKSLRTAYLAHVAKMFTLLGDEPALAQTRAEIVLEFETRLARASRARADLRDPQLNYHLLSVADLEKESGASWKGYFDGLKLPEPKALNVAQPAFVREFGRMLADAPLADWKTYLRWQLVNACAESLSSAFEKEDFHFYNTMLHGVSKMRPRRQRVQEAVDALLGEALGQLYIARAFRPEARARAELLVKNIRAALRDRLEHLDWMSPPTRREALRKLDAMRIKIGHPTKWPDYSGLLLDHPVYADNVLAARAFQAARELAKIDRPVDRDEWEVTPQTVNAYYKESRNEIVFPAAIWQPPFFDLRADDAVNYGAIGMISGHEMTHAFDDRGRQFDAEGNLRDWWAPADARVYQERAARLVKQYDDYVAIDALHVKGRLTLGENIADLGGLTIAFAALKKVLADRPAPGKIDGFTPEQRYFLAFAQVWRAQLRPEFMRFKLRTSDHTQGRYRVLGPLANTPQFFDAFAISPTEAGNRRNPKPIQIW
jgi:predicted metalloendopeptidase